MPDLASILLLLTATFLIAITPGPDQIYIATRSLSQGRQAGFVSALGINSGLLIHVTAAALGLSAVLAASPLLFNLFKYAGAAYLIYLGVRSFMAQQQTLNLSQLEPAALKRVYVDGLLINLLNPRAALFFLAFLPQFVSDRGNSALQILLLGFLAILVSALVDIAIVLLSVFITSFLKHQQQILVWVARLSAGVFIVLGLLTAFTAF